MKNYRMSKKWVAVEKVKEALYKMPGQIMKHQVESILDSLAVEREPDSALNQISSKNYGDDGVGLTSEQIDSLAISQP